MGESRQKVVMSDIRLLSMGQITYKNSMFSAQSLCIALVKYQQVLPLPHVEPNTSLEAPMYKNSGNSGHALAGT